MGGESSAIRRAVFSAMFLGTQASGLKFLTPGRKAPLCVASHTWRSENESHSIVSDSL